MTFKIKYQAIGESEGWMKKGVNISEDWEGFYQLKDEAGMG